MTARREMDATRDARIDLLRGIAIFVVLLLHFSLTYRLTQSPLADWFTPQFVTPHGHVADQIRASPAAFIADTKRPGMRGE